MAEYTTTTRGDNSTYGIIAQYLVDLGDEEDTPTILEGAQWSSHAESMQSWDTHYYSSEYAHPMGGDTDETIHSYRYKHILVVKTPPAPFPEAKLKSATLYNSISKGTLAGLSIVNLYKINQTCASTTVSPTRYCSQFIQATKTPPSTYAWKDWNTDGEKDLLFGSNVVTDTDTGHPPIYKVTGDDIFVYYSYIALDDSPYGYLIDWAAGITAGAADACDNLEVYQSITGGTWEKIYDSDDVTNPHILMDGMNKFLSASTSKNKTFFKGDSVPATMTTAQMNSEFASVGGTPGMSPLDGKYWIKIISTGHGGAGTRSCDITDGTSDHIGTIKCTDSSYTGPFIVGNEVTIVGGPYDGTYNIEYISGTTIFYVTKTYVSDDTGREYTIKRDCLTVFRKIRPYYIGCPCYAQPNSLPSMSYVWDLNPTSGSTDKDLGYSVSTDYDTDPPFEVISQIIPQYSSFTSYSSDLTKTVTEDDSTYYFIFANDNETDSKYMNWRKIDSSSCYLDLSYTYSTAMSSLKVEPNEADRTKFKLVWDSLKNELTNFVSYQTQLKLSSESLWKNSGTAITDIGTSSYVVPRGSSSAIAIASTAAHTTTGFVRVDTGGVHGFESGDIITISGTTDYNGTFAIEYVSATSFAIEETYTSSQTGTATPAPNNATVDFRIKVNLASVGYATGYNPYFYSNTVQAYRPGPASSSPFVLSTTDPGSGLPLTFTYASITPNTLYPISKRIFTWGDASSSEQTIDPAIIVADSGSITHTFGNYYATISPTVQWETTQGIRSVGTSLTTAIKLRAPTCVLSVPFNTMYADESIVISFLKSMSLASGYAIDQNYLYTSDTGSFSAIVGRTYTFTPTSSGTKVLSGVSNVYLPTDHYMGTPFDHILAFDISAHTEGYLDSGNARYADMWTYDTIASPHYSELSTTGPKTITLCSKVPFEGVSVALAATLNKTLEFYYWNGAWVKMTNATNGLTSDPAAWNATTNRTITYWNAPTDWATISGTTLSVPETTTYYYCIQLRLQSGESNINDFRAQFQKLVRNQNLHTLTVLSDTPNLMSSLTDVYVQRIDQSMMYQIEKNALHGSTGGQEPTHKGFGGMDISLQAAIVGDQSSGSGNYVLGSSLNSFDKIQKWANTQALVQLDVDKVGELSKDKIIGYISRLSLPHSPGDSNVSYFDIDIVPKRILRYVAETLAVTTYTESDTIDTGTGIYQGPTSEYIKMNLTGGTPITHAYVGGYVTISGVVDTPSYNGTWQVYALTYTGSNLSDITLVKGYAGTDKSGGSVALSNTGYVTLTNTPADTNADGSVTVSDVSVYENGGSTRTITPLSISSTTKILAIHSSPTLPTNVDVRYHNKVRL